MAKAKYCAGIKLNPAEFKIVDGIITLEDETEVSIDTAVSSCGQLWDGEYFEKISINGKPAITIATDPGKELMGEPFLINGNCGVGLDGRIFQCKNREVSFVDGYTLTVVVDPATATVTVLGEYQIEVEPTVEGGNQYMLTNIGGKYSVTVQKDGYTGKSQTIDNMGNQTITVELVEEPQS